MDDDKKDELKEKLQRKFRVEDDDLEGFGGLTMGDGVSGGG
ncbi:hypothetical protein AIOGIFDO_01418 [Candidatus Methanoperedenaceae archaeon GB37]|nr:hypothetical protein AIOGIFDO_01418 [Candidatus Methanoperedenaceae archaeon GB37]